MPGVTLQADGILRTRPQEVFVKHNGAWWIEAFHNVEVKGPAGRALPQQPAAPSGK